MRPFSTSFNKLSAHSERLHRNPITSDHPPPESPIANGQPWPISDLNFASPEPREGSVPCPQSNPCRVFPSPRLGINECLQGSTACGSARHPGQSAKSSETPSSPKRAQPENAGRLPSFDRKRFQFSGASTFLIPRNASSIPRSKESDLLGCSIIKDRRACNPSGRSLCWSVKERAIH